MRVLGVVDGHAGERGGDGRGGFHGGDFFLAVGLLGDAELVFHLHLELVGRAAELADPLAELARKHGQAFGPEENQRENKDDDTVRQAGHTFVMIRLWDVQSQIAVKSDIGWDGPAS